MFFDYIQDIVLIILELICCKIFFESFGKKRCENVWKNCAILFSLIVCGYLTA